MDEKYKINRYSELLDKNKIIFEKTSLKPWKFYKPRKQANYILECEKNKLNLKIGEKLEFV